MSLSMHLNPTERFAKVRRSFLHRSMLYYPKGSAPVILIHAMRQYERGRRPSMPYKNEKNPAKATRRALEDATLYFFLEEEQNGVGKARLGTHLRIDPHTSPLSYQQLKLWHDALSRKMHDGLEIEELFLLTLMQRLITHHETDLVLCYEDLLDNHPDTIRHYVTTQQDMITLMQGCGPHKARTQAFRVLIKGILEALEGIETKLDEPLTGARSRDRSSCNPN